MKAADAEIRQFERAKQRRQPHESVWRDCFDHSWPSRSDGFQGEISDATSIQARKAKLLDTTATDAGRILASGIVSGSTPANSRWFGLDAYGADDAGRRWLDDSSQTLFELIHANNFDTAAFECAIDLVGAGWFVLFVDENAERGGFTFEQWPICECYFEESKAGGRADTIYRPYTLTAAQAVAEFGENNLSRSTVLASDKEPDKPVQFLRCIRPRTAYVAGSRLSTQLPFESKDIELQAKTIARERGFHELPVIIPRWMRLPQSVYATGPMADALPAVRELNYLKYLEKANLDIAVGGMWIMAEDGVLNPRSVKVGARKLIVAATTDSMKSLTSGVDFNIAFTSEQRLQAEIRKILLADQLQPVDGPKMTAYEVHVRIELIRQLLGPVFSRMQAEYLQPLVERCFAIAYRAGVLGQPPQSLADRELKVKYISPLARAQKLEEVTAVERFNLNMANLLAVKPEVLDLIDADEMTRVLADGTGVPRRVLLDADTVTALRRKKAADAERAAQQSQQQQVATAATAALSKKAA